ncbi:MAG: DUF4199 domain-containing protein [Balneolaceae bacterium]
MEEINQNEKNPLSTSWPSIVIAGGIFSLISFVLSLLFGYQQINSEPSGAIFSPLMLSGVVICLVTCVAGAVAVWHYTKEVTVYLTLGQGALIGFLTGVVIVIFSIILNELWMLFDPGYTEKLIEATIANVEAMDMPASTKEDMIDSMAESVRSQQSVLQQLFWGIPITGLLNLISGMIGVKIFAEKKEESL